ncbi:thioesterase family protein [Baekduia soli]|uniref:Thioesterase family protein n=1 Tax=Baekduia soli TaxID=496014 RepID=A0A5B8U7J9_9ACTN|nr:thioesterase family protein [Baekduia soli]QEC49086.1 thioesterase family protein [Baekduia soli]
MSDAIFTPDGDALIPSEHARGPWDPGAMHGGAPCALLARAVERLPTAVPMRCVRLSVEFAAAVPLAPVTVSATLRRGGRRLGLADATLRAGDTEVLRATATLLRTGAVDLPPAPQEPPPPGPEEAAPARWTGGGEHPAGFHLTGMELRFARGDWERGAALAWFRLRMPLVAGEEPSALQRAVAAADFGNGVSRALDFATHLFVNTDLTVHLHREPVGEWVGVDARTDLDPTGTGQATSTLLDARGRVGTGAQSLYVDGR